jgi:hypothetical protein
VAQWTGVSTKQVALLRRRFTMLVAQSHRRANTMRLKNATLVCDCTRFIGTGDCVDGVYRYAKWHNLVDDGPKLLVIMHNPAGNTGDSGPTTKRLKKHALATGYNQLLVGNLDPYMTTDPGEITQVSDAVASRNDQHIRMMIEQSGTGAILLAWGKLHSGYTQRLASALIERLSDLGRPLVCLGLTEGVYPMHPYALQCRTPFQAFQAPRRVT